MRRDDEFPPLDESEEGAMVVDPDDAPPTGVRSVQVPIRISTDLGLMVRQSCHALLGCKKVFQRAGQLVRVIRHDDKCPGHVRRAAGSPSIQAIPRTILPVYMQQVSDWQRYDGRSKEWVSSMPPPMVAGAVSDQAVWDGMRYLVGISEWPYLREDGSIMQGRPQFDEMNGYLFIPSCDYNPVPSEPTSIEIIRARDALLEVVCDFPFAAEHHRSAWLAMFLTLLARPAIVGCTPFFPIDASLRGTGKTRLGDVSALIVTGRPATKMPQPQDNEEMRKALTSIILEGEPFCCFDNVDQEFRYGALDLALTTELWRDRLLGTQTTVKAPITTVFAATGNNMTFGPDTIRRSLPIRLESPLEKPHRRTDFRHADLLEWVVQERGRLVAAGLTILRAWHVAGRPHMGCERWGSFEAWSRIIPPALVHAGIPDPQLAQEELEEEGDPERLALSVIVQLWNRLAGGDAGSTIKQAVAQLYVDRDRDAPPDGFDDLRDALEELSPLKSPTMPPDPKRLGKRFHAAKGRVISGRRLVSDSARGGTVRWRVR